MITLHMFPLLTHVTNNWTVSIMKPYSTIHLKIVMLNENEDQNKINNGLSSSYRYCDSCFLLKNLNANIGRKCYSNLDQLMEYQKIQSTNLNCSINSKYFF